MIARVLEIQTPGNFLSVSRGHLIISRDKEKIGSVPIADIGVLLISNSSCSLSVPVLSTLAEQGAQVVLCGENFLPAAVFLSSSSIRAQSERLELQFKASLPLKRQLWAEIVRQKILNQASALRAFDIQHVAIKDLAARVLSGDSANVEAQASQRYWPLLMGQDFRRRRQANDANILLNYGYTVMRAAVIRSLVTSGLHLALPLHHSARENPAALADDVMEPFRPLIDVMVRRLLDIGIDYLCPESKTELAACLTVDIRTSNGGLTTLPTLMTEFCASLIESFRSKKQLLLDVDLNLAFQELAALRGRQCDGDE